MYRVWFLLVIAYAAVLGIAAIFILSEFTPRHDLNLPRAGAADAQAPDRHDCKQIFGTAYRSQAEMDWFQQNCSAWPEVPIDQASIAPPPPPSIINGTQGGGAPPQALGGPVPVGPDGRDCNAIRGTPYRSDAERQWYLQSCNGQPGAPLRAAAPAPPPPNQPPATNQPQQTNLLGGPDRTDCNAIRGTPYRSDAERAWFLQNCGGPGATNVSANSAPGPDGRTCSQVAGTPYVSDAERAWYTTSCHG